MSYKDKTMTCQDCGQQFIHSAADQEFYAQKGYTNEPKRCPSCRESRRGQRASTGAGAGFGGAQREMHSAVCAECGQTCEVPFKPRLDRPVYCNACYSKQRGTSGGGYSSSNR